MRCKEIKRHRLGQLNMMKIRQAYLTSRVSEGDLAKFPDLAKINIQISQWYEDESKSITLMSRSQDINLSEKVRIYHHELHKTFCKNLSILKLQTLLGILEGHPACAKALEDNVAAHLLNPAPLNPLAQAILLSEVELCFTDSDNETLRAVPSKQEVKEVLDTCRGHAALGSDSLTAFFYQQCWDIVGD